jgi:predicted esterase
VFAQSVQNPVCISPKGKPDAPVGVIYLHGYFQPRGNTWMHNLEADNRRKLQALADKSGVRIAVPLSEETKWSKDNGTVRSWDGYGDGPRVLSSAEKMSEATFGAKLGKGIAVIGFSDGGYAARRIGLSCAAKKPKYSVVLMDGANAFAKEPTAGIEGGKDCPPLYYTGGQKDKSLHIDTAEQMMKAVREKGREGKVLPRHSGGHELAPADELMTMIGATQTSAGNAVFFRRTAR